MAEKLFINDAATDLGYINIRDAREGILQSARWHCEYLWIIYQFHADEHFRTELGKNFDARYWEMYLTMSLIFAGYKVTCPKPGPDVGIIHDGRRVWFEATTPTRGAAENPDALLAPEEGKLEDVPEDKLLLRHLTAISAKCRVQYQSWLKAGIVTKEDAYVVALNTRELGFHNPNADPPLIIQAAYTVGKPSLILNARAEVLGKEYAYRGSVPRAQPADAGRTASVGEEAKKRDPIGTGLFQIEEYSFLSGLLSSHVDAANRRGEMGSDFQLVTNANATAPIPKDLKLRGERYEAKLSDNKIQVSRPSRGTNPLSA